MKLHSLLAALALFVGFTFASVNAAPAATTAPAATAPATKPTKFKGEVQAIDTVSNTISVVNKTKGVRVFTVAPTTIITEDGKPSTLAAGKVGDKVTGNYTLGADTKMTLTHLRFTTVAKK